MVFTADVGNTNIVLSAYDNDTRLFSSRIQTEANKTSDQYAIAFNSILHLNGISTKGFDGAIISCVVPPLQTTLRNAVQKLLGCHALIIGPGIKTGLNIKIDNPAILGSDLVCGAVAAIKKYKPPIIVFDLGTATKISAIDKFGSFLERILLSLVNLLVSCQIFLSVLHTMPPPQRPCFWRCRQ